MTLIMGVLNATPDSFYAPSSVSPGDKVGAIARRLMQCGADIIDIGGESSRPGASPVDSDEEIARITPVFEALQGLDVTLSIDTYHAATARVAIRLGATMVNDITALRGDPQLASVVAEADAECVLMHMAGTPRTMQLEPRYGDAIDDICAFFEERIEYAVSQGISENRIWLDPGFGFGKTVEHNLTILRRLADFKRFGLPLLIGTSNKSTIGALLDLPVDDRLEGTAATVAIAILNGADCVRVHDVQAMARVARVCDATLGKGSYV